MFGSAATKITKTVISGNKIVFVSHNEGTEDCEVKFQINASAYRAFRAFYNKQDNHKFAAFELYARSGGWYTAYSYRDVKDGALRVRRMINHALTMIAKGFTKVEQLAKNIAVASSSKKSCSASFLVKKVTQCGKTRVLAVSRKLQAIEGKAREKMSLTSSLIAEEFKSLLSNRVNSNKLSALQAKFAH